MGAHPTTKSSLTSLITPAVPTPPGNRHLALSNADRADMRFFTPVILLYEGQAVDFQTVVGALKDALRTVLVEYYPFAGRIARGESGVAEVRCDDSGAYFTEVVVEEALGELGGPGACAELAGMGYAKLKPEGFNLYSLQDYEVIPPLVVQITSFKCKTIALAVNWHHMVADGTAGMNFMKAWSEVARGLRISSPPDHRRHLMSARAPPQPYEGIPTGYQLVAPQEETKSQLPDVADRKKSRKKVEFTMSQSEIQQLKKQAAEENPSTPFTSGELISAHLWKLVTAARRLDPQDLTSFYSVLDGRKRMSDIPESFFGNCIGWRTATSSAAEVVGSPVGHVASLIRDSISGASEEYFRSVLDWLEVTGPARVAHDRGALGTHNLHTTFWRYFPIYELDFGFGKPSFGGRNNPAAGVPGFVIVCPTPDCDGAVAVTVFLYPQDADALAATLKLEIG